MLVKSSLNFTLTWLFSGYLKNKNAFLDFWLLSPTVKRSLLDRSTIDVLFISNLEAALLLSTLNLIL